MAGGLPAGFRPLHGLRQQGASTLASSGEVDLYHLQRLLMRKAPSPPSATRTCGMKRCEALPMWRRGP